jgi:hypothetical protein
MAPRKDNSWTEIDTSNTDDSDVEEFRLNMNDIEEDSNDNGKQRESQDTRRGILTVSSPKASEASEDDEDRAEVRRSQTQNPQRQTSSRQAAVEDTDDDQSAQGLEFGGRKNRAHKRIQNLLGTVRQKDQTINELAAQVQALSRKAHGAEKQNVSTQVSQYKGMMDDAETNLARAIDENDGKAVAKYSKELADSTMRYNAMAAVDAELPDEAPPVRLPQAQQAPEVPEAATEWVERNPWFKSDQKQHVIARMISQDLTQEGRLDPADNEYWEEMDRRLSKYGVKAGKNSRQVAQNESEEVETPEETPAPRRRGSPLGSRNDEDAGNTRQFTRNGNRVTATPTENDKYMSERLGVNLETFMREKYKYGNQDWKGYVPITIPNS